MSLSSNTVPRVNTESITRPLLKSSFGNLFWLGHHWWWLCNTCLHQWNPAVTAFDSDGMRMYRLFQFQQSHTRAECYVCAASSACPAVQTAASRSAAQSLAAATMPGIYISSWITNETHDTRCWQYRSMYASRASTRMAGMQKPTVPMNWNTALAPDGSELIDDEMTQ